MQKNYCDKCNTEINADSTIKIKISCPYGYKIGITFIELCQKCFKELFESIKKE
jgi:hypothetical protein